MWTGAKELRIWWRAGSVRRTSPTAPRRMTRRRSLSESRMTVRSIGRSILQPPMLRRKGRGPVRALHGAASGAPHRQGKLLGAPGLTSFSRRCYKADSFDGSY
jgi:hypothetical protein